MNRVDPRQWRFHGRDGQVRPGRGMTLRNVRLAADLVADASGALGWMGSDNPMPANLTLCRVGNSTDPIKCGERVCLHLDGAGYLVADDPGSGHAAVIVGEESAEWEITGDAAGVAITASRAVGLFNLVHGDHLVVTTSHVLEWSADRLGDVGLPIPPPLRSGSGRLGDVEVHGSLVPVTDGPPDAGIGLVLDPAVAHMLGEHVRRRTPRRGELLAPDAVVSVISCRWPDQESAAEHGPQLPPMGTRVWAQGRLMADSAVAIQPLRAIAWAQDNAGTPISVPPGASGWPDLVVTWRVVVLPCPDPVRPPVPAAWLLPLPERDGEAGTATTFTPVRTPALAGVLRRRWPDERRVPASTSPAIVRDARTGRRALRVEITSPADGRALALGCTARVHLPESAFC